MLEYILSISFILIGVVVAMTFFLLNDVPDCERYLFTALGLLFIFLGLWANCDIYCQNFKKESITTRIKMLDKVIYSPNLKPEFKHKYCLEKISILEEELKKINSKGTN